MARSLVLKTSAILKFRKPGTPRGARDFKRMYPEAFEVLKGQTGGRDFSDEVLDKLREAYQSPVEWTVVEDEYTVDSALEGLRKYPLLYPHAPNVEWVKERLRALTAKGKLCDEPNRVLKLCVRYNQLDLNDRQARLLDAISRASDNSGHPSEQSPLYCVGWIRWCDKGDGVWLVEEVQSDVTGVRKNAVDPFMSQQLRAHGVDPQEMLDLMDKVEPWQARLFEDAVGFLLEKAAEEGVRVEMVDYSYKADEESPQSVYTDLPRSMGMKLSQGSEVASLEKTWKITPNRRTSRRKSSRRRTSKRGR